MLPSQRLLGCLAAALLVLTACNGKAPVKPTLPKASGKPAVAGTTPVAPGSVLAVKQTGDATQLTGKVKIISDNGGGIISDNGGGIISDHGGAIIFDNGGGIISNNSGSIIANNGGGIISNNGSGLTSKAKRTLLATPKAVELYLADAQITLTDAAGRTLVDEAGKPLTATSDKAGNYSFSAVLPATNLVMHIKIHDGGLLKGGELTAMLPHPDGKPRTAPIDTSTSLGAAYVLGSYVQGSQAVFDKLPVAEADRLHDDLEAAKQLLGGAPSYQPKDLVALTETVRGQAAAVDATLKDIKALLLGQDKLGDGRQATAVAFFAPLGLNLDQDGSLLIGERLYGRIRRVAADGTISTLGDAGRGTRYKRNFPKCQDMLMAPDGTLYVATGDAVIAVDASDRARVVAGADLALTTTTSLPGEAGGVAAARLAIGPDGTLYIGERRDRGHFAGPPRVVTLAKDGTLGAVDLGLAWKENEGVVGLAVGPDNALYVLHRDAGGSCAVYKHPPGGPSTKLADGFKTIQDGGDLALGKDATVYVSANYDGTVTALSPTGGREVVADAAAGLGRPGDLLALADGTLLIADVSKNVIQQLAGGKLSIRAGTTALDLSSTDLGAIPLNAPSGAAVDAQGRLLVAENGGNKLRRFDGKSLELLAGGEGTRGDAQDLGDGGPALAASLNAPTGVAFANGSTYILDEQDMRVRKIDAAGIISSIAGGASAEGELLDTKPVPATGMRVKGLGLAADAKGRVYWSNNFQHQIYRVDGDQVSLVAGKTKASSSGNLGGIFGSFAPPSGPAAEATIGTPLGITIDAAGDLLVADAAGMRILRITDLDGVPQISSYAGVGATGSLSAVGTGQAEPATVAKDQAVFVMPGGICADAAGNVYVAELGTANLGLLTTLTGDPAGLDATGFPKVPPRVRKVAKDGKTTIVAGPGSKFFADPNAEDALVMPTGLAVLPDGRLAIVDTGANLIRLLPKGSY